MRQHRQSSLISPEKIASLEYEYGIGNYEVIYGPNSRTRLVFNGEEYSARYYGNYYGGYDGYDDVRARYIELRTKEILEDQKMIREFCYGA